MTNTATKPEGAAGPRAVAQPEGPEPSRTRAGLGGLLSIPGETFGKVVRSSATTPGRLSLIAAGLVALSLLAGLIGTVMVQQKSDTITELTDRREPLAAAAQQVYRALSDADATAASAFLSTGEEPAKLRQRYDNDIAQAGVFLAKAASDAEAGPRVAGSIDVIAKQLPVYTELVGTARANNRQGFPAGASYLREASELMRAKILPAAEELYRADTERLTEQQSDARGFPWLTTVLVLGLLAALIAAQRYLRRKTNRLFNVGLVAATAAVLIGLLWSSVALITQTVLLSSSEKTGTEQVDLLVRARIAALKARADETLTLVARGEGGKYEDEFVAMAAALAGQDGNGGLLRRARDNVDDDADTGSLDQARASAQAWLKAHAEVREKDSGGQYSKAVKLAIDDKRKDGTAKAFMKLDDDLRSAIQAGRQSFFDDASNGSAALTLLAPGWAVIGVIAALGVGVGIRERLREYR